MTRRVRIGLGVAMVALGAAAAFGGGGAVQAASPFVTLSPAQQNVAIGAGTVTYTVSVTGAEDLAGYEFNLKFDHYVLEFQSSQNGPFLATSARQTPFCTGPVVSVDKDTVKFGCATPGGLVPYIPGASGSGVLATFTFKLVGGGTSPLTFTKIDLVNAYIDGICNGAFCTPQDGQGGSITVDGPLLPRPTVDPAATPTVPAAIPTVPPATQTAVAALPAPTQTAIAVANAASTTGGGTQTGGTQTGTTGAGSTGADATSGVAGASASGVTQGDGTQPGGVSSGGGVRGASSGGGAQSANGAGVGKFGSGPDSYAHKSDNYGTKAIALAALGFMLIVAGIWRRGVRDVRREVVRRR